MRNENNLVWRRATSEDVPLLARINRELIEHEWGGVSKDSKHLERRMLRWISDPEYRASVFEVEGAFAAYVLVHLYPDEAYIRHFYVAPQLRGSGIGRDVCRYVLQTIVSPGLRVSLDVLASNTGGVRFWRSMGFREYSIVMEQYTAPAVKCAA
jgi:ribosomal protein S18 acetylase RimI-like enzyme